MKLVKGFSLIEVILAMAISIGLTAILFQSLSQSNRVLQKIINSSSLTRKMTIVQQIFDREISGIVFPEFVWDENNQSDNIELNDEVKKEEIAKKESPDTAKNKKEENSKKENFPLPFECQIDEFGNLKMFTFITTNPIPSYQEPQTHMVRIMYTLQPDIINPGEFVLMHQQSENFNPKKFMIESDECVKKYPILEGIKSIVVEFLVEKKEKEQQDKNDQSKDNKDQKDTNKQKDIPKTRAFEVLKEWKIDQENQKNKNDEKNKKVKDDEVSQLPVFIHMKITIFDDIKKTYVYEYWFAPLYDIQKISSYKSTGMATKKDQKSDELAFQENQSLLNDVRGAK